MGPKLFYFAERHPSLDADGFARRWREHGEFGMRLPRWKNVAHYTQGLTLPAVPADAALISCDGVATVTFRSGEARQSHIADPDGRLTKADEAETFARPVKTFAILTCATEIFAGPRSQSALFVALKRRPDLAAEAFANLWFQAMSHGAVTTLSGNLYVQNMRRLDVTDEGFDADCIDEIHAADLSAAWQTYRHAMVQSGADQFVSDLRVVAVQETVLYDSTAPDQA